MSNKVIAIIIAGVVLVGGAVWWFMQDDGDGAADRANTETTAEQDQIRNASINDLLAQGQDLMCTYSTVDEQGNDNSGTVYFADGRMSGDFSLSAEGEEPINSHMISDGQTQYFWEEGNSEGYKLSVEDTEDVDEDTEEQVSNVDQDEDYEFNCEEWNADDSQFEPPGDVDFIDLTAQIEQAQQEASQSLQETCAQIQDPQQRAACEASL